MKIMALDGNSLTYRAFFALPVENFSTSTGQHTNASGNGNLTYPCVLRNGHHGDRRGHQGDGRHHRLPAVCGIDRAPGHIEGHLECHGAGDRQYGGE